MNPKESKMAKTRDSVSVFKRYGSQEELDTAQPDAELWRYGPVLKYDGREFVQVYIGQNEWVVISLENPNEFYEDPGWQGTEAGWVFVDIKSASYRRSIHNNAGRWNTRPERSEGKPITVSAILFGGTDELVGYLGPDDPIIKSLLD